MRLIIRILAPALAGFLCSAAFAQQSQNTDAAPAVPNLIRFAGSYHPTANPPAGPIGATFAIYAEQEGGAPLWTEEQNIELDADGNYTVLLGSAKNEGVFLQLFPAGEARWVQVKLYTPAEVDLPRVLLVSVPYAMKAGDAATVGGLPPSAFVLAAPVAASQDAGKPSTAGKRDVTPAASTGTQNYIPIWTDSSGDLGNSVLYQSGTGATAKIGINITTPATTLDVKGAGTIRGALTLPTLGAATATTGYKSQPLDLAASAFNSSTSTAVKQTFQWQAEPVGNDTATTSGSLNLLYASGAATPAETGLSVASNGIMTFAAKQTFPGTGTVTAVTAGTALTGGGTSGNVTLNLDTTKVPLLNTANSFTGSQSITGNVTASGSVSGTTISGGQLASTAATGTAPLVVSSTTQVPNLNASLLDGFSAANFQPAGAYATLGSNSFTGNQSITGNVAATGSVSGTGANFTGTVTEAGALLPAAGTATASTGYNSQPIDAVASAYNSSMGQAASQDFRWLAEPVGNDTTAPSGKLDLLFGANGATPGETGLSVGSNGVITFAPGQTFPGMGTITGVTAGTALTGGGTSGNVTLNVDTSQVPLLSAPSNTFTGNLNVGSPGNNFIVNSAALFNGSFFAQGGTFKYSVASPQLTSTAATGTAPLVVSSTTQVANLNASLLGGLPASGFQPAGTIPLPYNGTGASTNTALFNITNSVPQRPAIAGTGAQALLANGNPTTGGTGVTGYGGASNGGTEYSTGGYGVFAQGGPGVNMGDNAGAGVGAQGGNGNFLGGAGIVATGGSGGFAGGDAIDAYGGSPGNEGEVRPGGWGIFAMGAAGGYAGGFSGDVAVWGRLTKSSGSFMIDHPLEPANKYLYHSFVESPDMMNIYNGNVVTDGSGTAVVTMPDWFEALNSDFRYQLTVIGQFAQAIIAAKMANGSFTIRTDKPNVEVSWQVTGIRQDAWAKAHRIEVEVDKAPEDRGHYIHPELFGHQGEPSIAQMHHPRPHKP